MFASLKKFISEIVSGADADVGYRPDDERLAAVALLVHMARIDGVADPAEEERLRAIVRDRFELDAEAAAALISEAEVRDAEAVDLYRFTSVLKDRLDAAGRARVVEMLWQIVYADGEVHEFEDNMVWRVAELLGVSSRERVLLRKKVEEGRA
ncbi:MAG TPA: TerB family tellurite resistance protein [Kaistiaceae bacterium]|nr:TerB family tellurite resistance protein [Kaistiaceae bacterium]